MEMKSKWKDSAVAKYDDNDNTVPKEYAYLDGKKQDIINAIYRHYGKPKKIKKERLKYYRGYSTPSGTKAPDWNEGGWQNGRLTVFVIEPLLNQDGTDSGLEKYTIKDELEGTWFFATNGKQVKVYGKKGEVHSILDLPEDK
jgi:hypothetical protein